MYGLVNKAIQDLVTTGFGVDKWNRIKESAGIEIEEFRPLDTYDDQLTYTLVAAASEVLKLPQQAVLQAFGKYWIQFTAHEGYGDLMDLFGRTFDECLINLNQMHARMGSMMPSLKPPRFVSVQTNSSETRLEYYSFRAGLGPMVLGLLEGLAEKHKTIISISYEPRKETHLPDIFTIKKVA